MHAAGVSLGILHALVIAAFTWARIARDGALLSRVAVEWIPWLTVLILAMTALASPVVGWLARQDPARAFARLAVVTGVSLVVWEWLLRQPGAWSALTLYVWVGVHGPLLVAQFWVLVQARLDPQQARRHIGWVGAAGILGGMAAGLLASVLSSRAGLEDLIGLTVLAQLGAGTMAMAWPGTPPAIGTPPAPPLRARTLLRDGGYARLLAVVVVLGAMTGGVVDYQFKRALQQQSSDAAALGTWLGLYNVAVGSVALAAQLVTPRLLARSGSRVVAVLLPSGLLAGAVAGLAWPAMPWPAVGTRLWEHAARISIGRTAQEFFFLPFQGQARVVMKHAAEGFLTRGGEVLASIVLVALAATHRADAWHLAVVVGLCAAAWLVHLGWLGRAYGPALSRSLDQLLRPGRGDAPAVVDHGVAIPELVALLRSRDARHVTFAIDELLAIDPDQARRAARTLVTHASREVRLRARRALMPARSSTPGLGWSPNGAAPALAAALASGDPTRATTACAAVAAAGDRAAVPVLLGHLNGATRALARETLERLGDAIVGVLGDTLVDARVPLRVRRDVTLVLARIGTPAALAQLTRVPDDSARTLRGLALRGLDAARKRGAAVPVEPLRDHEALTTDLLDMERRRRQQAAVSTTGDAHLRLLARALGEASSQARERVFRRLALTYPPREMLRAHRGLSSGDPRIAAFAIEYLEATLSPEHRDLVLPVLAAPGPDAEVAVDALLPELSHDADAWIAALATHVIGARRDRALAGALRTITPRDDVHAETLRWAQGRL